MTLKDIFGKWKKRHHRDHGQAVNQAEQGNKLTGNLSHDEQILFQGLGGGTDIIKRHLLVKNLAASLIYIEGIVADEIVYRDVLAKLQSLEAEGAGERVGLADYIAQKVLSVSSVKKNTQYADLMVEILQGNSVLLIEGLPEALVIQTKGGQHRAIEESPIEITLRGPRDCFIEDITINMALIRRRIKSPDLVMESTIIGQRSRTKVVLVYVSDIADPKIVQEIRHRLSQIETDVILAAGNIERFIEDHPSSLFPQVFTTEKPDRVVGNLMEGRVAIIVDGTPFVMVVPAVFIQFFQGVEDYYERSIVGSANRLFRFIAFMITVNLTGVYIALTTFHHSLLPMDLLLSVAENRQKVPFSPLAEAMFMEITIEILREAGLRLPKPVGQTLGVLGGIVVGQAVLTAHIVAPLMVVVVSLAAISSFVFPNYSMSLAVRLVKFPMMILASLFGVFGMAIGWVFFTIYLADMESFGVPYLAPLAPMRYQDMGDTFILSRIWKHNKRPASIPHLDNRRVGDAHQEYKHEK